MMSNSSNVQTKDALVQEIKLIKERSLDTYNIIVNSPIDCDISPHNIAEKSLSYVEELRTNILHSNTPVSVDSNFITSQFLSEIKQRSQEVDELIAFTQGSIKDIDSEIERLNNLTKTAKEALSKPMIRSEVSPEQLRKAKETFKTLKSELHGLIESVFPNESDMVTELLGALMNKNEETGACEYIQITQEIFPIIEILRDMNIVTTHPYNNMEVKLAL